MLWRVRTALPDQPGALAVLAAQCGASDVNILGVQIFPGIEAVTDELVLKTPDDWQVPDITALIERSQAIFVSANLCTEAALVDQPTRYVQAARAIVAQPARFPEVVAGLFDAEADPDPGDRGPGQDVLEMSVGDVDVQVRRTAPFTATEHARGTALAALVSDVLAGGHSGNDGHAPSVPRQLGDDFAPPSSRRIGQGIWPDFVADGDAVLAIFEGATVGTARLLLDSVEPGVREVSLHVNPSWQRRGIGTKLLIDIARLASAKEATEILITTSADNQAVLPMVLSAGLRGRIRMAADILTVRVPVRELKPLSR